MCLQGSSAPPRTAGAFLFCQENRKVCGSAQAELRTHRSAAEVTQVFIGEDSNFTSKKRKQYLSRVIRKHELAVGRGKNPPSNTSPHLWRTGLGRGGLASSLLRLCTRKRAVSYRGQAARAMRSEDGETEGLTWEMLGWVRKASAFWDQALEPIQVKFAHTRGEAWQLCTPHSPAQKPHFHMEINVLHKIHRFGSS